MSHHSKQFNPENWERLVSEERAQFQDFAVFLEKANPGGNEVWLDFGCGPGYFTIPLASRVQRVYALDISEEMVSVCRKRAEQLGITNVEYVLIRDAHIPLSDAQIDKILMANVFHELEKPGVVLEELHRILKPNGIIYLIDWKVMETEKGPPLEHRIPPEEVKADFQKKEFQFQEEWEIYPYHYVLVFSKSR